MTGALARLCDAHPGQSGVRLLDDGPAALAVRLALIRRARHRIDAQYYIWRLDTAGRLLLDELVAAAARGVQVRLLLDDYGAPGVDRLTLPGVALRLFNPGRLRRWRWLNALFDFRRLNRRMHNKCLMVDGIACVIGGRNIGDEYFDGDHPGLAADLDVLAIGAIAADVAADFERYWRCAAAREVAPVRGGQPAAAGPDAGSLRARYVAMAGSQATAALIDAGDDFAWVQVRMLADPPEKILGAAPDDRLLLPQLLAALGPVRRRLLLVSAYFVPMAAGAAALGGMAAAGVRVEVLTNSQRSNNVAIVHACYAPWRQRLLAAGVRLWEMRGRAGDRASLGLVPRRLRARLKLRPDATSFFRSSASELHAKTFIADGRWLFIGSMNLDPRSWALNTEMGFLIDSPSLAGMLEARLDAALPHFAWQLEQHGTALAWRGDGQVFTREPGTTALQRLAFRLLGLLPLGHFV